MLTNTLQRQEYPRKHPVHPCLCKELNPGPPEYKSGALTTELHRLSTDIHSSNLVAIVRIQGGQHNNTRYKINY